MTKPEENKFVITCIILFASPLILICGCAPNISRPNTGVDIASNLSVDNLDAQATRIIQQALAGSEPQVRANAIEIVSTIPISRARNSFGSAGDRFMPEVRRLLKDEFVPVRFGATVAIGDTGYSPAKSDVTQLLKDEDYNVRLAASYAISKLNHGTPVEQLHTAMSGTNQQVRANAAFLLGRIGDRTALPLLYQAIRDEASDDRVRLNSIEAIARLGDERIYQKLWAMLISAYADDRVCGIRAMGALGSTQAGEAILTMLKDDLPEVRLVAAEQLGMLGDAAGEKVVLDALTQDVAAATDQEGRARIHSLAALAIGQIRTPTLKKFLPELLKNESQFVRLAAAKAVFQCSARENMGR
jgi:HEAT repeat protein